MNPDPTTIRSFIMFGLALVAFVLFVYTVSFVFSFVKSILWAPARGHEYFMKGEQEEEVRARVQRWND